MKLALNDVDFPVGAINPSGVGEQMFWALADDIQAYPAIVDDVNQEGVTVDKYVNYSGDFTMKKDKKFHRLYNTPSEGQSSTEISGGMDRKGYTNKVSLVFPKFTDEVRAFAKSCVNSGVVVVFWHDNAWFVIGNKHYRTENEFNFDTGKTSGGDKQVGVTFSSYDNTPMPRYKGVIHLADGTYDCDTDTFSPSAP